VAIAPPFFESDSVSRRSIVFDLAANYVKRRRFAIFCFVSYCDCDIFVYVVMDFLGV
jgi:hypothetical protein